MHVPMVCFCDIPLSMLEKHMNGYEWIFEGRGQKVNGYGQFGLGMTKEWGIEMHLNPVAYTNAYSIFNAGLNENNLILSQSGMDFYKYFETLHSNRNPSKSELLHRNTIMKFVDDFRKALYYSSQINSFVKPYMSNTTGQKFYDEKEWRYVPMYIEENEFGTQDVKVPVISGRMPNLAELKASFEKMIYEKHMLKFDAKDVKYIIVANNDNVKDVIQKIESLSYVYNEVERNRLIARIITSDQIREDF